MSDSLADPYEELLRLLPQENHLKLDETGHKDSGQRMWTWCFRAALFTLFKVSPSRGSQVKESQNLAERFSKYGASYLQFITPPGIEPTNNLVEQAIRVVVIDRKITQGSRSESGEKWLERTWTVTTTCSQTGRSVFEFITSAVIANFQGEPAPSLVPDTS